MKKIIIGLLFILAIFFSYLSPVNSASNCTYDEKSISGSLNNCLGETKTLVQPANNGKELNINSGFKDSILGWVKNLSIFFSIMAVGSIVYGAFMLTVSAGEDEKIKKGKDIVKWGMIGFIAIISAGGLISIVINFMYTVLDNTG